MKPLRITFFVISVLLVPYYVVQAASVHNESSILFLIAGATMGWFASKHVREYRKLRARETPRQEDVPILAWKLGGLALVDAEQWVFTSMIQDHAHGAEAWAQCPHIEIKTYNRYGRHNHGPIPARDCSCGYYALKEMPRSLVNMGTVLLEVELAGRVVIHEDGYRAGHLRVLACWLGECNGECSRPATHLVHSPGTLAYVPVCNHHAPQGMTARWVNDVADVQMVEYSGPLHGKLQVFAIHEVDGVPVYPGLPGERGST